MTREEKNARRRERYAQNPEPFRRSASLWRRENSTAVQEADRLRKNTDEVRQAGRARYARNPEPQREASRLARIEARALDIEGAREKERLRRAKQREAPQIRLRHNLSSRIRMVLGRRAKHGKTVELLGMSLPEYQTYLQGQFLPGMTWENQGSVWHIDHIRPCASFDLSDRTQQYECFNWSNTQPLFAVENLRKGARLAHK